MNIFSKTVFSIPVFIYAFVLLFLLRVIFFAASYGGIEHDSGWYLGVAKNLAMRGIYASYTNTIREEGIGAHPSIHGRFSVQDKNGYSYFPAGVTVGPGYVVPEAIFLKIFGSGEWQYRLLPLLSYTVLFCILLYLAWRIGGSISLLLFGAWIWVVPQITTAYAYESYSEHIALLYLLLSLLFLYIAQVHKKKYFLVALAGVFLSFSILTKYLFFLGGFAGVLVFLGVDIWNDKKNLRYVWQKLLFKWGVFVIGFLLPVGIYEIYRYTVLVSQFGSGAWEAINQDIRLTFQAGGSGISNFNIFNLDWAFVMKKISIWMDVGISKPGMFWILFLFSPAVFIPRASKKLQVLLASLFFASVASFIWFIFISPSGWARHAWHSIMLGMLLTSCAAGVILQDSLKQKKKGIVFTVITLFFLLSIIHYESLETRFFMDQTTIEKWRMSRFVRGLEGFPSTPILSLSDQKELVAFFKKSISSKDRVYYAGWFLNAEISPLVDKVFYTLNRYFFLGQKNPDNGRSFLILGPYQQGPWSLEPPSYVSSKIGELCKNLVFQNSSYVVCELREGLVYNNPAY